jgi:hypothetical protein
LLDFIGGAIPLSLCIFSNFDVHIISLISVIKIVRLFDVLPGFTFLKKAINDKKDEIFYSLLLVAFGSFIISCIIYFIESDNPDSPFKSVLDTLIWSFSKYTNDYGDVANFAPRSPLAKFCATINGLLGVAVFAVPGALLASAFVEQISDSKKSKVIEEKIKKITQLFEESLWEISEFSNRQDIGSLRAGLTRQMCVVDRFWTLESLQSYLLYTENEIIEIVRNSPNLVYRVLNDESSNNSNRHKIVELLEFPSYFRSEMNVLNYKKKSYGSIYNGGENKTLIVCTNGRSESGILHFTATLASSTNSSYICQSVKVRDKSSNNSWDFVDVEEYINLKKNQSHSEIPNEFLEFKDDINSLIIEKNCKNILIFHTCSEEWGKDLFFTYGLDVSTAITFNGGSINDSNGNEKLFNLFCHNLIGLKTITKRGKISEYNFSISHHGISKGLNDESMLNNILFKEIQNNDININIIYINREIIRGWGEEGDRRYYSFLRGLMLAINEYNKIC